MKFQNWYGSVLCEENVMEVDSTGVASKTDSECNITEG